jgi:hypothetical protein
MRHLINSEGKLPALPGDSPGLTVYHGWRKPQISAKRKAIHDEKVPGPEPYEM